VAHNPDPISVPTIGETPAAAVLPDVAVPLPDLNGATVVPEPTLVTASPEKKSATPWGVAAGTGVTIGKKSQEAGVATAGFFTRLGKSIGRRF
jgi:hypothetical protein